MKTCFISILGLGLLLGIAGTAFAGGSAEKSKAEPAAPAAKQPAQPAAPPATAVRPGTILVGGGSSGSIWFPLASASTTLYQSIDLYGWGGYFLSGGTNIGPYLSVAYDRSYDDGAHTGSSTFSMSPGFQVGYFFDAGSLMLFVRTTSAVLLRASSTTTATTTTEVPLTFGGMWTQLTLGVASRINERLALCVGPTLNYYMSFTSSYMDLKAGLEFGLIGFL